MYSITKELLLYETWYEFRRELQRRSGIVMVNQIWLQIKPRSPLPWRESQMREVISNLSGRILRLKTCPRCSGNLVLDRDIDGIYKRCVQCSFEIEIIPPVSARTSGCKERQTNQGLYAGTSK